MKAALALIPASLALAWLGAPPLWRFAAAAAAIVPLAEWLRRATEQMAHRAGPAIGGLLSVTFGNAAEYFAAVYFARQNKMDLVMSIAVGASIQVALLTAPLLVLISWFMAKPMDLVFSNPLELVAVAGAALIVNAIARDGQTTWFEGLLLLVVYGIFGLAFFFATP